MLKSVGLLGFLALLLLAACGDSGSGTEVTESTTAGASTSAGVSGDSTTGPTVTSTSDPTTTTTTSSPPTTSPSTSTDTGPASSGSCLVGSWVITESEMNGFYDAVEAGIPGPGVDFTIEGDVLLTFTEDTYVYNGDFVLTLQVAGSDGVGESTGSVSGTYETVDGILITTVTDSSLDLTMTINGVTVSGDDMVNGAINANPLSEAPFDCDGPTIYFQVGAGDSRHPVKLTPA